MICTRWHPDDVAGRVSDTEDWKEGEWHHVNFQAIRHVDSGVKMNVSMLPKEDPRYLPREMLSKVSPSKRDVYVEKEVALWPERFPLEELRKRERLDPREFASLYQQSPYIQGGNLIKSSWWKTYDRREEREFQSIIIAADTAVKKTETADYSVLMVLGLDNSGDIYILDVVRDRYDFPELKRACIATNARWRGLGLRGLYIEDRASGQSLIQELRNQSGVAVIAYKVVADKVARLNAVTPMIEGGRVFLPDNAQWLDAFMDEMQSFPSGRHDDIVDSLSMGLDAISRMGGGASDMLNTPIRLETSLAAHFEPLTVETKKRIGPWVDNVGKENDRWFASWGEL